MELKLRNGDYVPDGRGGVSRLTGNEALLQRVLFRLTARRGSFPFLPSLGSRLWRLGQLSPAERLPAARQYVEEALEEEPVTVEDVTLAEDGGVWRLKVELRCQDAVLPVTLEIS